MNTNVQSFDWVAVNGNVQRSHHRLASLAKDVDWSIVTAAIDPMRMADEMLLITGQLQSFYVLAP